MRYAIDEDFKQKKKEKALAYYYKMKELKKQNAVITAN